MAIEAYQFAVTTPAGTPLNAPITTAIPIPVRTVSSIRWRVPPGPRGVMGFQIAMAGVAVLPSNRGQYIVADNDEDTWPLADQPDSGAWQVISYNTGTYPHTVFVTLLADLPGGAAPAATIVNNSMTGQEV